MARVLGVGRCDHRRMHFDDLYNIHLQLIDLYLFAFFFKGNATSSPCPQSPARDVARKETLHFNSNQFAIKNKKNERLNLFYHNLIFTF